MVSVITLHPSWILQARARACTLPSAVGLCSAGPHVTALCPGGTLTERGVARVISELSQPSQRNPSVGLSLLDMNPGSIQPLQSRAISCIPQLDWLLLKSSRDYGHQRLKEYIQRSNFFHRDRASQSLGFQEPPPLAAGHPPTSLRLKFSHL